MMFKQRRQKIRIMVDDVEEVGVSKNARRSIEDLIKARMNRVIELETGTLEQELSKALSKVYDTLAQLPFESGRLKMDSISFSLIIDASGTVSILSSFSGSASTQTGFVFSFSISRDELDESQNQFPRT